METARAKPYHSRSLAGIESSISSATNSKERLILHARRAALFAHSSRIEEARKLVLDLRELNQSFDPRLSSWIMYCEAIIYHSESLDARGASERLRRAYPFAAALKEKDPELAAGCAAWLAHCYFALGEHKNIAKYLREAFEWAQPDKWNPLSRAALTLADCLSWAGRAERARDWYREARHFAANDGDVMMQNAVIYNSAAFRVADVWLRRIRGHEVGGDAEFAEMEVESSDTFNTLLRNSSNPELLPILKAELLSALGKCREAVQEFEDYFGGEAVESLQRYNAKLLAEHAYCVAYLGRLEEADMLGKKALAQIENCRDFDDLAVVHHCLGTVGEHLGQAERSEYHFEARDLYLSEFARIQEEARQEISSIDLDFGEKLRTKKSPA